MLFAKINICSRARTLGIFNGCVLEWEQIYQHFGYDSIQSMNESTEFRYETTGYKTIVGLKKARVLTDRGFRTTEYQQT